MKVLVFEPKFVGHFLGFAAHACNAVRAVGCDVVLSVPQRAADSTQAAVKLGSLEPRVEVDFGFDVPVRYDKWVNARFETAALADQLERHRPDHVVVPSGDFVLPGLLRESRLRRRLGDLGTDLVLHNPRQVYPGIGKRDRLAGLWDQLAVSMSRRLTLHTVDPFATSKHTAWPLGLWGNPVRPLPHFHDRWPQRPSRTDARRALGLPATGRMLGSIGDLGRRKGTELLIKSFVRADPGPDVALVLFGILSRTAKALLEDLAPWRNSGRIVVRDEFVPECDFRNFLFAVDAIWAGFPWQIGIASTLLHAADAQLPAIASDYGCVGWMTRQYGLGRTYPAEEQAMTDAIRWFEEHTDWRPDPQGTQRLLDYHNTENFERHLTARLRERLGDRQPRAASEGGQSRTASAGTTYASE
jgi:hypothetical protein